MKPIHTLGTITLLACTPMTVPTMAQTPQTSEPAAPAPAAKLTPQQAIVRALLQASYLYIKYDEQRLSREEIEKKLVAEVILDGCPEDFRIFYHELLANWMNSQQTYNLDSAVIQHEELLHKYGIVSGEQVFDFADKKFKSALKMALVLKSLKKPTPEERKKIIIQTLDALNLKAIQLRFNISPLLRQPK